MKHIAEGDVVYVCSLSCVLPACTLRFSGVELQAEAYLFRSQTCIFLAQYDRVCHPLPIPLPLYEHCCTGAKKKGCRPRLPAIMVCVRTSGLRSGRATSEWPASTCTWAAMIVRSPLLRHLTRQSCCAMSTAVMARTPPLSSPTSLLSTTRQAPFCQPSAFVISSWSYTCYHITGWSSRGLALFLQSCCVFSCTLCKLCQHKLYSIRYYAAQPLCQPIGSPMTQGLSLTEFFRGQLPHCMLLFCFPDAPCARAATTMVGLSLLNIVAI